MDSAFGAKPGSLGQMGFQQPQPTSTPLQGGGSMQMGPAQVNGGQAAPQPQPASQPQAQAPQMSPQEQADFAAAQTGQQDSSDSDALAKQESARHSFDGKEVETTFFGLKARVTKGGEAQIYNSRKKDWETPGPAAQEIYSQFYRAFKSVPSTAGAIAGTVGGSMLGGGVGGEVGAALGRTAGSAAGAYAGETQSGASGENPHEYVLRKLSGVSDDEAFGTQPGNRAMVAGGLQGVFEGAGALAGGKFQSAADAEVQAAGNALGPLKQGKQVEDQYLNLGQGVRPAVAMQGLPGGTELAAQERNILAGGKGAADRLLLEKANYDDQQNLTNTLHSTINKVAPGVDFDDPEIARQIQTSTGPANIFQRVKQSYQEALAANRDSANEIARNRQFDPQPILSKFEGMMRDKFAIHSNLFDPQTGEVKSDQIPAFLKANKYSDKSIGDFMSSYSALKNAVKRPAGGLDQANLVSSAPVFDPSLAQSGEGSQRQMSLSGFNSKPVYQDQATPVFDQDEGYGQGYRQDVLPGDAISQDARQMYLGPNQSGERSGGITYKQLTSFTDMLQGLSEYGAQKKSQFAGAIGQVARESRMMEDDLTAQLFAENNQPRMAQRTLDMKNNYFDKIDSLNQFSQQLDKNIDNVGGWLMKRSPTEMTKILSVMNDQQQAEARGTVLREAFYNSIIGGNGDFTARVSGSKMADAFMKSTKQNGALEKLLGSDNVKDLQNLTKLAQSLEQVQSGGSGISDNQAGAAFKRVAEGMIAGPHAVSAGAMKMFINRAFSGASPGAQEVINSSMDQLIAKAEAMKANAQAKSEVYSGIKKVAPYLGQVSNAGAQTQLH